MARTSLLTAGLDALAASASPPVAQLLKELFALDDELQTAHAAATQDDENGERVVSAYEAFLRRREALVAQLEKERVAVPWQLRMRIDDIELTLRERKEKRAAAVAKPKDEKKTKNKQSEAAAAASGSTTPSSGDAVDGAEKEDEDPLLLLKAMILPSAFVAVVAGVIYGVTALYG